jgi:hypothetical protein
VFFYWLSEKTRCVALCCGLSVSFLLWAEDLFRERFMEGTLVSVFGYKPSGNEGLRPFWSIFAAVCKWRLGLVDVESCSGHGLKALVSVE